MSRLMRSHRVLPFLRAFDAVARHGNLRSSAAELGLTPGAVSYQMKMLEQAADLVIFDRSKRRLDLSPQGQMFHRSVSDILGTLDTGLQEIAVNRDGLEPRHLVISAPSGLGHAWLAPKLVNIANRLGLTSFESRIALEVGRIDWREVDIAIVYDNPPWPGFHWQILPQLKLSPVCSPTMLNNTPLRSLRELAQHRLLHEDRGGEWGRWLNAAKVAVPPTKNAYFNRLSMAINVALSGGGLALVSNLVAHQYLISGALVQPFNLSIPAAKAYYFVVAENRKNEALIEECHKIILSEIAD